MKNMQHFYAFLQCFASRTQDNLSLNVISKNYYNDARVLNYTGSVI